jgi:hypothetical protein
MKMPQGIVDPFTAIFTIDTNIVTEYLGKDAVAEATSETTCLSKSRLFDNLNKSL